MREIDPNWQRTPSLSSMIEGRIAAERAAADEARERVDTLNRLGITRESLRSEGLARSTEDVLRPGGQDIGTRFPSAGEDITTVSPDEFRELRDQLLVGARPLPTRRDFEGLWFARPDGSTIALRWSQRNGATIEVIESKDPMISDNFKVHQR